MITQPDIEVEAYQHEQPQREHVTLTEVYELLKQQGLKQDAQAAMQEQHAAMLGDAVGSLNGRLTAAEAEAAAAKIAAAAAEAKAAASDAKVTELQNQLEKGVVGQASLGKRLEIHSLPHGRGASR
jgi:hypothetical protein